MSNTFKINSNFYFLADQLQLLILVYIYLKNYWNFNIGNFFMDKILCPLYLIAGIVVFSTSLCLRLFFNYSEVTSENNYNEHKTHSEEEE